MKVHIGSQYQGIPFDRPALRQLPRHWTLEESRPVKRLSPEVIVGVAIALAWVFAIVQTVREMLG